MKPITKEQKEEFEKLARPLIKFLNDNFYPHMVAVIDTDRAKLTNGFFSFGTDDYIGD